MQTVFNSKEYVVLLLLILFCTVGIYSKNDFTDNNGGAGHADDISKLLTGKGYYSNSGNYKLFPILTGLTYIMYLTVDSTWYNEELEIPHDNVTKATKYLEDRQKELKINGIPNIKEFLTPGGSFHGEYTHLGWDHPSYAPNTAGKWSIRKEILRDFLGRNFAFGLNDSADIIKPSKRDSFAALLYYVHILGDHENNTITTARSRIPIKSLDEQDDDETGIITHWERNDKNENGIPMTTIIVELNTHLKILFRGQENTSYYKKLFSINGYLPGVQINAEDNKTERAKKIQNNQKEKAKWILDILFYNVPYLLRNESFAKGFYAEMQK
jgi:hypothetical protein